MYCYSHVTCSLHKQDANTGCPLLVEEISSANFAHYEVVMGGAIRSDSPGSIDWDVK